MQGKAKRKLIKQVGDRVRRPRKHETRLINGNIVTKQEWQDHLDAFDYDARRDQANQFSEHGAGRWSYSYE